MNYELLKKLQDAGFPLVRKTVWTSTNKATILMGDMDFELPTLDEFIEACGSEFGILEREDEGPEDGGVQWIAFKADDIDFGGTGSTPLIAVANLWLALQTSKARG